jgi:hypothetical protein
MLPAVVSSSVSEKSSISLKTTVSRGGPTRFPAWSRRSASGRTEGPPARHCELVPLVLLWPLDLPALAGNQQLADLARGGVPWQTNHQCHSDENSDGPRVGLLQTKGRLRSDAHWRSGTVGGVPQHGSVWSAPTRCLGSRPKPVRVPVTPSPVASKTRLTFGCGRVRSRTFTDPLTDPLVRSRPGRA